MLVFKFFILIVEIVKLVQIIFTKFLLILTKVHKTTERHASAEIHLHFSLILLLNKHPDIRLICQLKNIGPFKFINLQ
jgi:hypothetical protein